MDTHSVKELYKNGTTRACVFTTIHKESTMKLMDIFINSGLGGYIGKVNMDRNSVSILSENAKDSIRYFRNNK